MSLVSLLEIEKRPQMTVFDFERLQGESPSLLPPERPSEVTLDLSGVNQVDVGVPTVGQRAHRRDQEPLKRRRNREQGPIERVRAGRTPNLGPVKRGRAPKMRWQKGAARGAVLTSRT